MQGAEERRVRRVEPYAATRERAPARLGQERMPARLGQEGNAADGLPAKTGLVT